jgi:hypothetical protein
MASLDVVLDDARLEQRSDGAYHRCMSSGSIAEGSNSGDMRHHENYDRHHRGASNQCQQRVGVGPSTSGDQAATHATELGQTCLHGADEP